PFSSLSADFVSDWSPLHDASIHGRLLALKKLITQVNGVTIDWHTPLFNACVSGNVACLNLLLQHGASPHAPCDLASPIHEAAKRATRGSHWPRFAAPGQWGLQKATWAEGHAGVPSCSPHWPGAANCSQWELRLAEPADAAGHIECVESLTSNGVNIDLNIKHLGTPLYVACENEQVACAKKLLESGASADGGKDLDSPLHAAARNSNADLVHLLIDFGADVRAKNAEGKRPVELVPPSSTLTQIFVQKEGVL
ncbi:Ankyrin repeat and SOCS box protein 9, partial [Chelonia mydas]